MMSQTNEPLSVTRSVAFRRPRGNHDIPLKLLAWWLVAAWVALPSCGWAQYVTNILIPSNAVWRVWLGTNEASTPTNLWRSYDFDDSAWQAWPEPLHYGTNSLGGDDELTTGTILKDMKGRSTTLFTRKTFVVTNASLIKQLTFRINFDGGFSYWLGPFARSANMTLNLAYTAAATKDAEGSNYLASAPGSVVLHDGTNVLAVQGVNYFATNEDYRLNVQLEGGWSTNPPLSVTAVAPAAGGIVTNLSRVAVTFVRSVTGVQPWDLVVNGAPASWVTGANATYTFGFLLPPAGGVQITWSPTNSIRDTNGNGMGWQPPGWTYTQQIQASGVPTDGLIGWWPAEGNGWDITGGHDGVLMGGADFDTGHLGQAFHFSGSDAWVAIPHNSAFDFGTGDFSVHFWVLFNSTSGEQVLVEKYIETMSGSYQPGWMLTKLADSTLLFSSGPIWDCRSSVLSLPTNTWMHCAIRRTNQINSIFVNGIEVATAAFDWNVNCAASLKIGHRGSPTDTPGSSDTRGFFLNGRLDELMIYNRALSDAEIATAYLAEPPHDTIGLSIYRNPALHTPTVVFSGPAGSTNEFQYADALGETNSWHTLTNVVVPFSPYEVSDLSAPPGGNRFYRVKGAPLFNPDPANLVWIPPGQFTMGSPTNEWDHDPAESPQTVVTISRGFWMSRYKVTQGAYLTVVGNNPSAHTGDLRFPVEMVTWYDATNYASRLTLRERNAGRMPSGYVYRLPTEAEREYACRAGTTTRLFYGDDLTYAEVGLYAWCAANSGSYTHPVGQKQANPWGLYDMIGNAWEWCFDWWGSLPGGKVTDPVGPVGPTWGHVLKGSDCYQPGATCRSAHRNPDQPTTQSTTIGFRVVLAPILP